MAGQNSVSRACCFADVPDGIYQGCGGGGAFFVAVPVVKIAQKALAAAWKADIQGEISL